MLTVLETLSISDGHHHPGAAAETQIIRDIHALPQPRPRTHRRTPSSLSNSSNTSFSSINDIENYSTAAARNSLSLIGEEETSFLGTIVPDFPTNPSLGSGPDATSLQQRVKREEVEWKIGAWQNAEVAKINNRFKREKAVINGREREQIQKANSWMKKVERRLEEKRAVAVEKMENEMAKARRKAEERKASAASKRGTKVAKLLDKANLMRATGKSPPTNKTHLLFTTFYYL